jgi:hypothetical protein
MAEADVRVNVHALPGAKSQGAAQHVAEKHQPLEAHALDLRCTCE